MANFDILIDILCSRDVYIDIFQFKMLSKSDKLGLKILSEQRRMKEEAVLSSL